MRTVRHSQRGVTLLIALIMLIAMTLAGLALFRQVGTGVIIARNLTFRESALAASDQAVATARAWLTDPAQQGTKLDNADTDNGYFPAWCNVSVNEFGLPDADSNGATDDCGVKPPTDPDPAPPSTFSPSSYNWNNSVHLAAADGNQVDYVIHRLCSIPGNINASGQQCVTIQKENASSGKMSLDSYQLPITGVIQPYYRVTTRVVGPMNTLVYTQVMIY